MITIKNVTFTYANSEDVAKGVKDINLTIKSGECIVLCGESGCGKTTISRLINGLIPHFYKGELEGEVLIDDHDVMNRPISDTAKHVGSVFQNPSTQFFNVDTTSELAFGCENQQMEVKHILERMEHAEEKFNLNDLMNRSIFELSGGEKQRIACGSTYATKPKVFVLDEPSSSLDFKSIKLLEQVLKVIKEEGHTIIISEHRLYYLKDIADRFIHMKKGVIDNIFTKETFLGLSQKEVTNLGLRTLDVMSLELASIKQSVKKDHLTIDRLVYKNILNIDNLRLNKGEVTALTGCNGAGKTTFVHCLSGLNKYKGKILYNGKKIRNKQLIDKSFMVMQDVNSQLFTPSIFEEVTLNVKDFDEGVVEDILNKLSITLDKETHPMALSGGQKQRVAVASAIVSGKELLIFDEPTSGLDYKNMMSMSEMIDKLSMENCFIIVITHDIELILDCCNRVIRLENGQVADDYNLDSNNVNRLKEWFAEENYEYTVS